MLEYLKSFFLRCVGRILENILEELSTYAEISSGNRFYRNGQYIEAIICWKTSLDIYQKKGNKRGEADCLLRIGDAHSHLGDYLIAIDHHKHSLELFQKLRDRNNEAKSFGLLGVSYSSLGQPQKAIEYFQKALEIFQKTRNKKEEFTSLIKLGNVYLSLEKYQNALECYQQCLKIAEATKDRESEAKSLGNLGMVYESLDEYQRAIKYQQQSLKIFKEIDNENEKNNALNSLGNIYDSLGDYQKAIECYQQSLEISQAHEDIKLEASTLGNLAGVYSSLGQYQQAIEYRQMSLEFFQELECTNDEAIELNALGNTYESLGQYRKAIEYRQMSLEIYKELDSRGGKAGALGNLGSTYHMLGEYRKAITFHQQSLEIYQELKARKDQAISLNGLGSSYLSLGEYQKAIDLFEQSLEINRGLGVKGGESSSLEHLGFAYHSIGEYQRAIKLFQQSLDIENSVGSKPGKAGSLNNLGSVYQSLGRYQKAIEFLEESLEISRKIGNKQGEATALGNLGNAYYSLNKIQEAIVYYQQSVDLARDIGGRQNEANSLLNLGNAYYALNQHPKAIEFLEESLKINQNIENRQGQATAIGNLGVAYADMGQYQKAITYLNQSLEISRYIGNIAGNASLFNNLGGAYQQLQQFPDAIGAYRNSLAIAAPSAMPVQCALAGRNLGKLAFTEKDWYLSIDAYQLAIEAIETIHIEALTDSRREQILSDSIDAYFEIIQAYINIYQENKDIKNIEKAIEYIERSKARNLVNLLANRNVYPKGNISQTVLQKLDYLRRRIIAEQKQLEIEERNRELTQILSIGKNQPKITLNHGLKQATLYQNTPVVQLQRQLDELIAHEITPTDPTFKLTQKVEPIRLTKIQSLIDEHTAVIEWYITNDKVLSFVITTNSCQYISSENSRDLISWSEYYLENYYLDREQWKIDLEASLHELTEILNLDEILSNISIEFDQVVLIPHRILHSLPLHALPIKESIINRKIDEKKRRQDNCSSQRYYLLDFFSEGIRYAPSCQFLQLAQIQLRPNFYQLFAIQNPTGDLIYADLEVEVIRSFFSASATLTNQVATEAAVKTAQDLSSVHCGHFACHGEFNPLSPLESALILTNGEHLTLGDIFDLSLPQCRLVTLSACETGLTDINSISDEYVGLPSGFLLAGSQTVVSSLWTVDDLSTAFLMIKFYENLQMFPNRQAGEIAASLNRAQKWLRDLTIEEFDRLLEHYKPQIDQGLDKLRPGQRLIFAESLKQIHQRQFLPFANVYYWGAFNTTGF